MLLLKFLSPVRFQNLPSYPAAESDPKSPSGAVRGTEQVLEDLKNFAPSHRFEVPWLSGGDVSPLSATVSATMLALLSAPTDVAATAPSKSYVTVTWTPAPSGMPLASYTVFRGTTASSLISLKTAPPASCTLMTLPYWWAIHTITQCRPKTRRQLFPLSAIVAVTTPQPSPDKHSFRLSTLTTNNGNVDHAECLLSRSPCCPPS